MRRLLLLGLAALMATPVGVHALSLGNLELRSSLRQPLNARIPILSATGDEIDTLNVRVASPEHFERAGVSYAAILTEFRFDVQETHKGPDYIVITTRDSIGEPFLNFLIEVNWSKGRLIREYTALLDPPLYDPNRRIAWSAAQVKRAPPPAAVPSSQPSVAEAPSRAAPGPRSPTGEAWRSIDHEVYHYGGARTAQTADRTYPTLWSAAKAMRPNSSVTMQQMLIALLRTNPEAFIRANINLLKKGYVLKMPDQGTLASVSREEALAEVKQHHALWQEYRQRSAVAAPTQPAGAVVTVTAAPATGGGIAEAEEATSEDKLKLLSAKDGSGAGAVGGASGKGSTEELALTKETLVSRERENEELRAQLVESEEIIEKLKSRVALQDNQLADLQRKLAEATGAAAASASAAPAPTFTAGAAESGRSLDQEVYQLADAPRAPAAAAPVALGPITAESWRSLDQQVDTPTGMPPSPREPDSDAAVAAIEPPASPPAPSGTGIEPPSSAESPPTAPVSDTPPDTPAPTAAKAAPEQAPAAAAEAEPAPTEAVSPEERKGLIHGLNEWAGTLLPRGLLAAVPGGVLTLLGALAAVMAGIVALIARRGAEPAPPSIPTVADMQESAAAEITARDRMIIAEADLEEPSFGAGELFAPQDTTQIINPPPVAKAAPGEPAEDPLAEVNVYLAYERFDEAERLIKEAIVNYPNEHKYKLRLLEVHYSSNNKTAYEAAARRLHGAVGGTGLLWESAVAMWREMSPNRELFAAGLPLEPVSEAPSRQFVDITAIDEKMSRTVTSAQESAAAIVDLAPTEAQAERDNVLDFDLGASEKSALDLLDITAPAEGDRAAEADGILDISADRGGPIDNLLDMSVPSAIEGASPAVNELLSLTKSGAVQTADSAMATLAEPEGAITGTDFDVTGGEPDLLKAESAAETLVEFDLSGGEGEAGPFGPTNVVDFPVRQEAQQEPTPPEALTTMVDIAPSSAESPPLEFDIGSLDLSADASQPPVPEVFDVDPMNLDADTVRLFENDLAASREAVTAHGLAVVDSGAAATADDLDLTADLFDLEAGAGAARKESTLDELPADSDNLTLDDITRSLEETVGMKDEADIDTVDLTLDAGVITEMDAAGGLFRDDLKPASAAETVGLTDSPFGDSQGTADELDTKLNLAKAYIELGDAAGARSILDEVANAGSERQREEAQRLLRELTT
ncbi:MAG: FimV/HubP family polar landmark protein [Chromatiales bacterium]